MLKNLSATPGTTCTQWTTDTSLQNVLFRPIPDDSPPLSKAQTAESTDSSAVALRAALSKTSCMVVQQCHKTLVPQKIGVQGALRKSHSSKKHFVFVYMSRSVAMTEIANRLPETVVQKTGNNATTVSTVSVNRIGEKVVLTRKPF